MPEILAATKRNVGLDSLRALAILLVIFQHGTGFLRPFVSPKVEKLYNSGWTGILGVELFFCLSGFLIGTLLIDIESNGVNGRAVWTFLIRRWMRTLPLYYLVLLALVLAFSRA